MTLMIPRVMSWAISGTPIRRHIEDLHSLLRFLHQEPIASNKRLWKLLTAFSFRSTFVASYQRIMHRYAKRDVAHELQIPRQHRLLYGIELTEIERAHYVEVWEECLEDCKGLEGWLSEMDRKVKDSKRQLMRKMQESSAHEIDVDKLQAWLVRLRQTCCHPQIGTWSKETLGRKNVRTIDAVLDIMLQKTCNLLNAKQKALLSCKIKRAILSTEFDRNADDGSKVLALFEEIETQIRGHVEFWRARVQEALEKKNKKSLLSLKGKEKATAGTLDGEDDMEDALMLSTSAVDLRGGSQKEQKDGSGSVHPSVRFRDWQEQHHRILFFMASTFAELGLVDKETEYYSLATSIRHQMLAVPQQKFDKVLDLVLSNMHAVSLEKMNVAIKKPTVTVPNGSNSSSSSSSAVLAKLLGQFQYLVELMNKQQFILEDWRSRLLGTLTEPLSDHHGSDGDDTGSGGHKNGSGLQDSLESQNVAEAYVHHYGRMLFLRKDLLLGAPSVISNYVTKARDYKNHAAMVEEREERARRLLGSAYVEDEVTMEQQLEQKILDLIKPDLEFSFKTVRTMMEALTGISKGSGVTASSVKDKERALVEARKLKAVMDDHVGQVEFLETELEHLRELSSARSLYYRQLQGISDTVIAIDSKNPGSEMVRCLEEETVLSNDISKLTSKQRYLEHIAESMAKEDQDRDDVDGEDSEDRLCLICSDRYHYGLMTECGHVFCETCLTEWTKTHSKCPSCKSHISKNRLTSVSMTHSSSFKKESTRTLSSISGTDKEQPRLDLTQFHAALSSSSTESSKSISDHIHQVPEQIRQVKVETGYGSKIDSIVRHIRFLIQEDPAVKCLVFSQWSNLLHLLTDSLTINQVGFVRLDGASNKSAVHEFKTNKDKHVFMLHAKSQSAGLTLLQATHVFICEPLVNPALQAQAVSRVHRIGQTKETFVHYYLLQDTVEVPCFELFERNSAAATGSNRPGTGRSTRTGSSNDGRQKDSMIASKSRKSFSDPTSTSIEILDDDSMDSDICNNNNQGEFESVVSKALDSATVTTASAAADSQRNNGEQVKEDDLRYCFLAQRQTAESLQRVISKKGEEETPQMALVKDKENKGEGKDKDKAEEEDEDISMGVVCDPELYDPDAFMEEDHERRQQVYVDEDGTMTSA
ncbi:hypothetical protein BGZ58_009597 [Dissophora ornata]|nr:hypothetical protein BGZ58_009597 [Dissophora ornata]